MSKTYKDAPYRIRERRLRGAEDEENCSLCLENKDKVRSFTTGFTAIFFAHEVAQLEGFVALAEEKGFEIDQSEVQGYLGKDVYRDLGVRVRFSSVKSAFDGFYDSNRAIYSAPRGIKENLIWNLTGTGKFAEENQYSIGRSTLDFLGAELVSHKQNIFTVVSISKTIESKARSYHGHHQDDSVGYLLWGHCHCSYCEPDEKSVKNRIRSVTTALKKVYNGGDYDALEEIAEELVRSGANAQRESMYC